MLNLLDTLKKYGRESLGYPSEKTLKAMYKTSPDLDEHLHTLLFEPQRSMRPMLYHTFHSKGHYVANPEEYVPFIQAMLGNRYSKAYSINQAKTLLIGHDYIIKSDGQLSNIWNRVETRLKLADKKRAIEKNQEARIRKAKAEGKKKLQPKTEAVLKGMEKARKVRSEKLLIERLKKEEQLAKRRLAKAAAKSNLTVAETKEKLDASKPKADPRVVQAEEAIKETGKKVLYEPTPKQADFHAADEDIVLYGGAAGGGKSYAMLMDALRFASHPTYRGLIIRRTSPMLKELVAVSRTLYPKAFPGAKFNKSENVWYFPNGGTIQFGYLDKPEDLDNYQGLPYTYIGFDEIQHQRSDEGFIYLLSRLRHPELKCYMRASANPGGSPWVKEFFIDPAESNTTFFKNGLSVRFIPAKLEDNPYLDTPVGDEEMSPYRKMLNALPETQRKQLLEGDWMVGDDAMFAFNPMLHVTKEMPPLHWSVVNGLDYGFRDPAAALWGAVCPNTGQIVIYQEHEELGLDHVNWAKKVLEREGYLPQGVDRVIDHSVFNVTGHTGPGVREQIARVGLTPRPADRNREAGWNQIHQRLIMNPDTGVPGLLIHESCEKLIDQLLSARINEKKPDDIDEKRIKTKGRTHHWDLLDALRYLLMARPQRLTMTERNMKYKSNAQSFQRYHGYFQ